MTQDGEQEIDLYVRRLLWALQALPHDDRLGIASEIHDHLSEVARRGAAELDKAIGRLGAPDALARSYVEEYELAGAINRAAPGRLLFNVLNRATRSVLACVGGLAALTLYLIAAGFGVIAVAKFVTPANVGLWIGPRFLAFAILDAPPPGAARELLGYGVVPVSVVLGAACFIVAGRVLRLTGRRLLARARPPVTR